MSNIFSTIRSQIAAGFAVIVILLLIVVAIAAINFNRVLETQGQLSQAVFQDLLQIEELEVNNNEARLTLVIALLEDPDPDEMESWEERLVRLALRKERIIDELRDRFSSGTAMRENLDDLRDLHELTMETRVDEVVPAILAGDFERAREITVDGVQAERFEQMNALISEMLVLAREPAATLLMNTERQAAWGRDLLLGIGFGAVILTLPLSFFLARLISRPLSMLAETAERIGEGDLTMEIPKTDRSDDIGKLSRSFRSMLHGLRRVNLEIQEGVNVLASTSTEILAATSQMANGVSETASAVSETTSTLDQARQTANLVSEKARTVSEVSQNAANVSRTGRKEVESAIGDMEVIRDHMENMGRNIARLHEHSQAISDIVATVNDLSEQSNLLAVNAAIEAAKAGETGKGFSVVAREMKSLAVQSKQATSQVRSILTDIQQTANSTVMATERGHKVVAAGVTRSKSAGEAIRKMTESASAAAQAAMQISASSNEQLVGMDQVATAMEDITQASHQNAAGTKQSEEGARSVHDLGARLRGLVERYKL